MTSEIIFMILLGFIIFYTSRIALISIKFTYKTHSFIEFFILTLLIVLIIGILYYTAYGYFIKYSLYHKLALIIPIIGLCFYKVRVNKKQQT